MCPAFRSQPIEFNGLAPESFALARLSAHMTRGGGGGCETPKSACARRLCESREQKFGAPRVTRTAPWIMQANAKACIETAFRVLTSMDFNYFCKIRPVLIRARSIRLFVAAVSLKCPRLQLSVFNKLANATRRCRSLRCHVERCSDWDSVNKRERCGAVGECAHKFR